MAGQSELVKAEMKADLKAVHLAEMMETTWAGKKVDWKVWKTVEQKEMRLVGTRVDMRDEPSVGKKVAMKETKKAA